MKKRGNGPQYPTWKGIKEIRKFAKRRPPNGILTSKIRPPIFRTPKKFLIIGNNGLIFLTVLVGSGKIWKYKI